jgi:hypothetical protein
MQGQFVIESTIAWQVSFYAKRLTAKALDTNPDAGLVLTVATLKIIEKFSTNKTVYGRKICY